ncbi:hypothetical protein CANARDRAFT_29533 [[Candida] arabinofermentans NRRL YB-2248]|uniref:Transcription regulator Rua1 C-terminal domain-containing protein n=1 Tax=[Candida] arabinofermentans NRRL YB-2248 TaxID=983967 RepID=A0A1E4SX84_9ASCO|nr:hypothetical protein CANARDRAFT_29533 [[Candida] arabinofermentans NRRL YB-2248]
MSFFELIQEDAELSGCSLGDIELRDADYIDFDAILNEFEDPMDVDHGDSEQLLTGDSSEGMMIDHSETNGCVIDHSDSQCTSDSDIDYESLFGDSGDFDTSSPKKDTPKLGHNDSSSSLDICSNTLVPVVEKEKPADEQLLYLPGGPIKFNFAIVPLTREKRTPPQVPQVEEVEAIEPQPTSENQFDIDLNDYEFGPEEFKHLSIEDIGKLLSEYNTGYTAELDLNDFPTLDEPNQQFSCLQPDVYCTAATEEYTAEKSNEAEAEAEAEVEITKVVKEKKPVNSNKFDKIHEYYSEEDHKKWLASHIEDNLTLNNINYNKFTKGFTVGRDVYNVTKFDKSFLYASNSSRTGIYKRHDNLTFNFYEPLVYRYRTVEKKASKSSSSSPHYDRKGNIKHEETKYKKVDVEHMCPYCPCKDGNLDDLFHTTKDSSYLHHVTLQHGVYSNGVEMELPRLGQAYASRTLKTKGEMQTLFKSCAECAKCGEVINVKGFEGDDCGENRNKLLNYYRHMLTHKQGKKSGKAE